MTDAKTRSYFSKDRMLWIIILLVGLVLGSVLCVGMLHFGAQYRAGLLGIPVTPILTLVEFATPSPTQVPTVQIATPEIQISSTPPSTPGTYQPGELVEIFGTEGDGLRVREAPGLLSTVIYLGIDNEVFQIGDGPVLEDGFEWWYLLSPSNEARKGWAVSNYLRAISE